MYIEFARAVSLEVTEHTQMLRHESEMITIPLIKTSRELCLTVRLDCIA